MSIATLTSKRQITLPADACAKLRLVKGSKVDVSVNAAGEIVLRPKAGDIRRLRGIVKYDGPPVSIEAMNEAILAAASKRFRESVE
jgi:AbrB family looped-hinge helix DNA binding protein